jgi:arylsulfatase
MVHCRFSSMSFCMALLRFLFLGTLAMGCVSVISAANSRPNIVLIMADDLGFSDLGCYGSEIETPNLDQLASEGLRFNQFYNTAKCHSSRICLLTGLYMFQAGNQKMDRGLTIAEVLKPAGYQTMMVGKWHLDGEPTDRGFDRYFGHLSGATNFFHGDKTFRLDGEQYEVPLSGFYTTDAKTDFALQFLEQAGQSDKPFFLYLAYNAPHYPLHVKEQDFRKYENRYASGWDSVRKARFRRQMELGILGSDVELSPRPADVAAWEELSEADRNWEAERMAAYAGMVDCLDQNIGRLMVQLEKMRGGDNTIVIFCSDNGACPFERTRGKTLRPWDPKSYWTYDKGWAHVGNTPFRWYKQNQHEGGITSPMIVSWSGLKTEPGSVTSQPAHLIDFMATCAELAGANYPRRQGGRDITPLQGKSLTPIFAGKQREPHDWLYFQFSNNRAIRRGDWKLASAKGAAWELYDLSSDRSELNDQAGRYPDRVNELKELWHRVAEEVEGVPENLRKPVGSNKGAKKKKPRQGK